jgi:hypothetical protein
MSIFINNTFSICFNYIYKITSVFQRSNMLFHLSSIILKEITFNEPIMYYIKDSYDLNYDGTPYLNYYVISNLDVYITIYIFINFLIYLIYIIDYYYRKVYNNIFHFKKKIM